jgi:hypothetical protein
MFVAGFEVVVKFGKRGVKRQTKTSARIKPKNKYKKSLE